MFKKVYIIAEIGINHCGKINFAKKLINIAKNSGANAVKFQTYITEKLVKKDAELMPYQKKNISKKISQYQMLKQNELSKEDHKKLIKYCKLKKIDFISTSYDIDSAKLLIKLGVKTIKVASTDITNVQLIRFLLSKKNNIIISSGATDLKELKLLFKLIGNKRKLKNLSMLHCISYYPTPLKYLNLSAIKSLKKIFKIKIGFSDHSLSINTGGFAVIMGAEIIEKHITLDKKLMGPDHKASMSPIEFKRYVEIIRDAEMSIGNGIKKVEKIEKKTKKKMQKSLILNRDLQEGQIIKMNDVTSMRPANGISPLFIDKIISKKINKDKSKGDFLSWKDIN